MIEYYQYRAFGLNISSSIELPDLNRYQFDLEDVTVELGENPKSLDFIKARGVFYQASKNKFLFMLDNIASYFVQNGNRITVDVTENTSMNDVQLFLLGPVFGALVHQRGLLPLHGSTVVKDKHSTLICGKSGSGKSTLAALLTKKGYSLQADDISIVKRSGSVFSVVPGLTNLKLWEDVAQKLYDNCSRYPKVRDQLLRYKVKVKTPLEGFENIIKNIVILEKINKSGFEIEEAFGAQKFALLKDNTYREQYIVGLETTQNHFNQINDLIQHVRVFIVRRPESPLLLKELVDFIEENLILKQIENRV